MTIKEYRKLSTKMLKNKLTYHLQKMRTNVPVPTARMRTIGYIRTILKERGV